MSGISQSASFRERYRMADQGWDPNPSVVIRVLLVVKHRKAFRHEGRGERGNR